MIIACDTSSVVCSVAVAHQETVLFQREDRGGQIHIEKLSPFLEEALAFCESQTTPLTALAVAIGPGSFNGLRIGLATMKALAVALELPLIPIFTTDAMAYGLRQTLAGKSRAVIFSHRNFVHFADYDLNNDRPIVSPEFNYGPWDGLFHSDIDNYFGTSDRGFQDWLQTDQGQQIADKFTNIHASAAQVAILGESNEAAPDLDELEPFYNAHYEAKKWIPPEF